MDPLMSGGSQLSVTPTPGDPMPSSGLCRDPHSFVHTHTHRNTIHTVKNKIILKCFFEDKCPAWVSNAYPRGQGLSKETHSVSSGTPP